MFWESGRTWWSRISPFDSTLPGFRYSHWHLSLIRFELFCRLQKRLPVCPVQIWRQLLLQKPSLRRATINYCIETFFYGNTIHCQIPVDVTGPLIKETLCKLYKIERRSHWWLWPHKMCKILLKLLHFELWWMAISILHVLRCLCWLWGSYISKYILSKIWKLCASEAIWLPSSWNGNMTLPSLFDWYWSSKAFTME